MDYVALKLIHQGAVAVSITGFFARGAGALAGAAWMRSRAARTVPHVVDTVLLATAVALAWMLRLDPLATPWLAAKIAGLLVYIGLGMVALRPARPRALRAAAWIGALACFAQIVATAITKDPLGLLALA
jgi:uncharacterized membrane protein SirB2